MDNIQNYDEFINELSLFKKVIKSITAENVVAILRKIIGEYETEKHKIPTIEDVLGILNLEGYKYNKNMIQNVYNHFYNDPEVIFGTVGF